MLRTVGYESDVELEIESKFNVYNYEKANVSQKPLIYKSKMYEDSYCIILNEATFKDVTLPVSQVKNIERDMYNN